jgi:hypothetical protein
MAPHKFIRVRERERERRHSCAPGDNRQAPLSLSLSLSIYIRETHYHTACIRQASFIEDESKGVEGGDELGCGG